MSEAEPSPPLASPPEPADLRTIRQLVRLMAQYDLTAIDLGEGPHKIRLRRRGADSAAAPLAAMPPAALPATAPIPATAPAAAALPAAAKPEPRGMFIESPMVGTFYAAGSPDAPPFVSAGSVVRADTPVCIIEAMKVFTDIPAGIAGTITEVLVKNGQPVEFGQHLFRIEPA
jgi:acetyl-CoA carboxylase biotin carboxyl carrier protein